MRTVPKLLAVDIGNTNITFGVFKNRSLLKKFYLATKNYKLSILRNKISGLKLDSIVICSVVPKVTLGFSRDLRRLTRIKPYIIGKDIFVPIENRYRRPKEVGQDRLVNAYAAINLYGAPLIAIDFGTAITFDVISKNKEYLGGMIIPGLKISLEALNKQTALLPNIRLDKPKEFIGRDTKNSMLSGIIYGFAALTDDLIKRICKKIGKGALVIGTGGNIKLISGFCKTINRIDPDLTLKGINLIFKNKKKS